jgi:iron-sulfur cluster assembly protein
MIDLTDRAVQQFTNKIRYEHSSKTPFCKTFRLGVKSGGCNGYEYVVDYAESVHDDDELVEFDDFNIVINPESVPYIQDSSLDYVTEGLNSQFRFVNPNVEYTCGCGVSVNFVNIKPPHV